MTSRQTTIESDLATAPGRQKLWPVYFISFFVAGGSHRCGQPSSSSSSSGAGPPSEPARAMLGDGHVDELLRQMEERCIAHIDVDCFYCEVERQRAPRLRGKPMAVLQYNPRDPRTMRADDDRVMPDSDGSIIAVSYEARAQGVTRVMRGREARKQCPSIVLVQVPVSHSKSDLTIYREAGARVISVLARFATSVCRASIDEAYVDVTARAAELAARLASGAEPILAAGVAPAELSPDSLEWTWVAGVDEPDGAEVLSRAEVRNGHAKGLHAPRPTPAGAGADGAGGAAGGADAAISVEAARVAHMESLRGRAAQQQADAQAEQARSEAASSVCASAQWWRRPLDEWRPAELLLAAGARVVHSMRRAVLLELGFSCSAGVAHSMTLAKLGCSMHKPGMQTALPSAAMARLLHSMPIERVKGLGGQGLGRQLREEHGVRTLGDLASWPLDRLVARFDAKSTAKVSRGSGVWLYRIARGIDLDEVKDEPLPGSHGVGKNFVRSATGALTSARELRHWLGELAAQVLEQLREELDVHERVATRLTVHWANDAAAAVYATAGGTRSRSLKLSRPYSHERIVAECCACVERETAGRPMRVGMLGLIASGMEALPTGNARLTDLWTAKPAADADAPGEAGGDGDAPDAVAAAAPAGTTALQLTLDATSCRADVAPPVPPMPARVDAPVSPEAAATDADADGADEPAEARPAKYVRLAVEEIEPSVLAELPADVRRELLEEIRGAERSSVGAAGHAQRGKTGRGSASSSAIARGRAPAAGSASIARFFVRK